ncbi:MAG TPA: iron chelate uptake ABC transporter family permease subunit, partial [Candidatus Omnitrophota bacterium]|nr:iron chelate uptake ABC transporter family permease subunit [Candidatus Omnitrophota bacterium]
MDEFLLRALAAGLGLALVAAPFGCFVVWRRMAYFGDTLAHTALLGVVAGTVAGIDLTAGVAAVALMVALLLANIRKGTRVASDTVLGIVSHGALAAGLVALSLMETVRVDLMGWLFGDILAVGWSDVLLIWLGGAAVLAGLAFAWRPLVAMTVDEDLALVEGHPVAAARVALMVLIALVVAAAMKIVGVLLVTSLLVVPAATARAFARTPEQMAAFAALAGAVAVGAGLAGSWSFDTPAGPTIVVV